MNPLQLTNVSKFLLNDVTPEEKARIEQELQTDSELAACVELGSLIMADFDDDESQVVERPSKSGHETWTPGFSRLRKAAIVLVILMFACTSIYAIHRVFDTTIFKDRLTSKSFDLSKWENQPNNVVDNNGGIRPQEGSVLLVNRGWLQPKLKLPEAYSIELEWKWHWLGLDPLYSDHLTIALRTDGIPNPTFFGEVSNGILVKFDATAQNIAISFANGNPIKIMPKYSVKLPYDEWHKIKIIDDGLNVSVFVEGPEIDSGSEVPQVSVPVPKSDFDGPGLAVYNREFQRFPHESEVRHFFIRQKPRPTF